MGRTVSVKACMERLRKNGLEVDPGRVQTHFREVFHSLDNDKKGWLNKEELRAGFRMNGLEVDNAAMQELWKVADANQDQAINLDEFQAVWELAFVKAEIAQLEEELEQELLWKAEMNAIKELNRAKTEAKKKKKKAAAEKKMKKKAALR